MGGDFFDGLAPAAALAGQGGEAAQHFRPPRPDVFVDKCVRGHLRLPQGRRGGGAPGEGFIGRLQQAQVFRFQGRGQMFSAQGGDGGRGVEAVGGAGRCGALAGGQQGADKGENAKFQRGMGYRHAGSITLHGGFEPARDSGYHPRPLMGDD